MKCLSCGREMENKETHFVCPNLLCDYAEEIENSEIKVSELLSKPAIRISAQMLK